MERQGEGFTVSSGPGPGQWQMNSAWAAPNWVDLGKLPAFRGNLFSHL